jgi:hypothetical protein
MARMDTGKILISKFEILNKSQIQNPNIINGLKFAFNQSNPLNSWLK